MGRGAWASYITEEEKWFGGREIAAGDFVFLSGAEARGDEDDITLHGIKAQTELSLRSNKI